MKSKRWTILAAGVVALLLLSATTLASGLPLHLSPQTQALATARQALEQKYGITKELTGLFGASASEVQGKWIVDFYPSTYPDKIGTYIVWIEEGEPTAAFWQYDGVDPGVWASGSLEAAVWGPAQIEAFLQAYRSYYAQLAAFDWSEEAGWSLDQRAAIDERLYAGRRALGIEIWVQNVRPGPEEVGEDQALQIAKEAILQAYGQGEKALEEYAIYRSLRQYAEEASPVYLFSFQKTDGDSPFSVNSYEIEIDAASGEVRYVGYAGDAAFQPLPEGPLDQYGLAVEAFLQADAFALLDPAQKADLAARLEAAGYECLPPSVQYVALEASDIPQDTASRIAAAALREAYGFSKDSLSLFSPDIALLEKQGRRLWSFSFHPQVPGEWSFLFTDKMGTYHVEVDAASGDVSSVEWSEDSVIVQGRKDLNQSNWSAAPVYDAKMLPWILELLEVTLPLAEKADSQGGSLSLEAAALHDQAFRDAGFGSPWMFTRTLPGPDGLQLEQAQALGIEALVSMYEVSAEQLQANVTGVECRLQEDGQVLWCFDYFIKDAGRQDTYIVQIDAGSGMIMQASYHTGGNG